LIYLTIAVMYFVYVFMRAFQQRNVIHNNYKWIPPVSYAMAACDTFLVFSIAKHADTLMAASIIAFSAGTGGAIGCIAAMILHDRMFIK
jgi:hypothetical protein